MFEQGTAGLGRRTVDGLAAASTSRPWVLQGLSDRGPGARCSARPAFDADKPGTADWAITWLKLPAGRHDPRPA